MPIFAVWPATCNSFCTLCTPGVMRPTPSVIRRSFSFCTTPRNSRCPLHLDLNVLRIAQEAGSTKKRSNALRQLRGIVSSDRDVVRQHGRVRRSTELADGGEALARLRGCRTGCACCGVGRGSVEGLAEDGGWPRWPCQTYSRRWDNSCWPGRTIRG